MIYLYLLTMIVLSGFAIRERRKRKRIEDHIEDEKVAVEELMIERVELQQELRRMQLETERRPRGFSN